MVCLLSFQGRRNTGSRVSGCSPNFGAGEHCTDHLQVEVTSIRLFLLCTKLTKLVDFYDVTGYCLVESGDSLEHTVHSVHFNRFAAN